MPADPNSFPDQGEQSLSGQEVHEALWVSSLADLTHANPYFFGDGLVAELRRTKEDAHAPVEVILSDEKNGIVVPVQVGPEKTLVGDGHSVPWRIVESDSMAVLANVTDLVPDGTQGLAKGAAALAVPEMAGTETLRALIEDLSQLEV